jgi:DNA-binding NtrC family response regulator
MKEPRTDVWMVHPPGVVRELYVSALERSGLSVDVADNVVGTRLEPVETEYTGTLVLELLPVPDEAWHLIERTRRLHPQMAIVIITSLIRPDGANRRRARELGCAAFLAKPCGVDLLVHTVVRVRGGDRGLEITTG